MKSTSIAFSEHWEKFTAEMVSTGRYGSVSEVVREGLRLVEQRQRKIDHVRALIEEGEASGPPVEFDFDAYIAAMEAEDEAQGERRAA